jgi:hypothetical protein
MLCSGCKRDFPEGKLITHKANNDPKNRVRSLCKDCHMVEHGIRETILYGQIESIERVSAGLFNVKFSIGANPVRVNELKIGMECEIHYTAKGVD